ncbi:5'-hydroxyaverantin dehydrogenase [Talaromyces pinophilus]|nr:5'-hydroxyaverantin dehydrogenase [Talaromyces pinophilus]
MVISPLAPTDLSRLRGLSVLISGGASGLGLSSAILFAKSGAFVTIADIQDGSAITAELSGQGCNVQFVHCDVTDWDSQVRAFQAALKFSPTKTLHMVAAFAGIDVTGHLIDHVLPTEVSLEGPPPPIPNLVSVEVNLKGTFYTATLALHYLRLGSASDTAEVSKSLTIVSSLAGYIDDTHSTAYTASKFGSRGLFRAIRAQAHEQLNIRVNAICPWAMKTPMIEAALQRMADFGILPDKGITLVPHDVLTQALARIAVDESISGRAIAIVPEGAVDIGDDIDGSYGGTQLVQLMALRKEAGDFLHS